MSRWLIINGVKESPKSNKNFLLQPYNPALGICRTPLRKALLDQKPQLTSKWSGKSVRICKDTLYLRMLSLANKYKVRGHMLSLAAAHGPEIFTVFNKKIRKFFVNCQKDLDTYRRLTQYQLLMRRAYRQLNKKFELRYVNINDYMLDSKRKFAIMDLDYMQCLDKSMIDKITLGINKCSSTKSLIAIWHSGPRSAALTDKKINRVMRPYLRKQLKNNFNILYDDKISYYEAQNDNASSGYPMRVDILVLERKL